MRGLDPRIHADAQQTKSEQYVRGNAAWIAGSSPAKTP
jgi:hypothetical protein